jgi:hypothetical protein
MSAKTIDHGQHPVHDTTGKPAISMEARLRAEVQRSSERLEESQRDLRRWLLSHGHDQRPDDG